MKIALNLGQLEPEEIVTLDRLLQTSGIGRKAPRYERALHEALWRQVVARTTEAGKWLPDGPGVLDLELPDADENPADQELFSFCIWAMSWATKMLDQPLLRPRLQPFMAALTKELYGPFHQWVADAYTARQLVEGLPASRRLAKQRSKALWKRLARAARREHLH